MNTVVCFYWQGDRWQEKAGHTPSDKSFQNHLKRSGTVSKELAAKYVNNLFEGVSRWTKEPFKFICFTCEELDLNPNIETRPWYQITSKGVLPRMYMFSEDAGLFGSQVLCLDIDVIITGSLDNLLQYRGLFCTRKSWTRGEETLIDGDIMSFSAGKETEELFWNPLVRDIKKVEELSLGGRERFWVREVLKGREVDTWQEVFPGQVCSYKFHVMSKGKVPQGTRIISCHGYPRPHQIETKWRTEYWK
jgi:hypothetical protein